MAPLTITVPGVPQGKAGARSVVRRGRLVHYTPRQTRSYETTIRVAGEQEARCEPAIRYCSSSRDEITYTLYPEEPRSHQDQWYP